MKLLQCPLPCHPDDESQSHSDHHLHSESSNASLYSQPSLPSVPSLTPSSLQEDRPTTQQLTQHRVLKTLKGDASYVFCLSLHGKYLYSGSSESQIQAWEKDPFPVEATRDTSNNVVAVTNGAVKCLTVLADKLISGHQDNKIRVWKIDHSSQNQKLKCLATLPTFRDKLSSCLLAKNYVQVRRHKKSTWVNHVDTVSALAVSTDGSLLYSASWDRSFKIWRTSDFKCLESVSNAHEDAINALVLSSDGFFYTGSADRKIKVWKKQAGDKKHTLLDTLEKHKSAVNALALSNDGSVLYSGACDRSILVWEKDSSSSTRSCGSMVLVGALRGHTKAILCLVVVDGLVCSGSADKTVRIWRRWSDQKSYSCLSVLEGHRRPIKSLAAAVDCSRNNVNTSDSDSDSANGYTSYLVYTGSLDCDIKIWQLQLPKL